MDKMKLYAVISPLCILLSQGIMPAQAQQLAGGKIQVESVLARKNGNRMDVAFRMNLNELKMKSEQQIVFTPVMVGTDSIALNPIIIQGRNQAVRYRRLADSKKNPQAQVLTRKNKTSQQVYFAQSVPYQKWMKKFKLSVKEDLCGCGNLIEQDQSAGLLRPVCSLSEMDEEVQTLGERRSLRMRQPDRTGQYADCGYRPYTEDYEGFLCAAEGGSQEGESRKG